MVLAAGLCTAASLGCHAQPIRASKLPTEWLAPESLGPSHIDLSRLVGSQPPDDALHSGDLIHLHLASGLEEEGASNIPLRVDEDGTVNVPLVGKVMLDGLDVTSAEAAIHRASIDRGIYRNPHVAVALVDRRTNRISVTGAVNEPGVVELAQADSHLLAAVLAAGGLAENAGAIVEIRQPPRAAGHTAVAVTRTISDGATMGGHVIPRKAPLDGRNGTTALEINLGELEDHGAHPLLDGAVVHVRPQSPRMIHVLGLVKRADQFEIPADQEVRLLDALAMAGGRTLEVADTVRIVRHVEGRSEPVVIAASVRQAKRGEADNLLLAPGDVVSVEETPTTFTIDTLRSFIRFGFSGAIPGF